MTHKVEGWHRRQFLAGGGGALLISTLPTVSHADEADMIRARTELFGGRDVQEGRVTVTLPPIAENGHSVPITVDVDSPMTPNDYVKQIVILSPRNPLPTIGQFYLTPRSGKALVSTRIRMSGTQAIQAVAEMSDGSLWSGRMETVVTLAACVVL
ncbi:MAG: thiosulfate oxidation carrier protein SoxY [Pseudomonadota bacterium]